MDQPMQRSKLDERRERVMSILEKTLGPIIHYDVLSYITDIEASNRTYKRLLEGVLNELTVYRHALEDFAGHGTRTDTHPTIGGEIKSRDDVMGFYNYMRIMDNSVRERALEAMDKGKDVTNALAKKLIGDPLGGE